MRTIFLWALFATTMKAAAPFCAFDVRVQDPSGTPLANIPVVMYGHDKHLAMGTTDASGLTRFCDAPLQRVDFAVGVRECGVVFLKGAVYTWPETRHIYVTYDPSHCSRELVPPSSCEILLRVHDDEGRAIPDAQLVSGRGLSQKVIAASDALGRIFRRLKSGERLDGVVEKGGLERARISEDCARDDERDVEVTVVLHRPGTQNR